MNRAWRWWWAWVAMAAAVRVAAGEPLLVLTNREVALSFDGETGAWVGLTEPGTGVNLLVGGADPVGPAPARAPSLDGAAIAAACADGRALDLTGDAWRYAPERGREPDSGAWLATAVPGRRGVGDDRLHGRAGVFWYEHSFMVPAGWAGRPLVLVMGAVDDFDESYLNGVRVGGTGEGVPHHWETPRYYRLGAGVVRAGETNVLRVRVTNGASEGGIAGPVVVGPAAGLAPPAQALRPLSGVRRDSHEGAQLLRLTAQEEPWEYILDVRLDREGARFSRQLSVRNISGTEQLLQTATLVTPPLSVGAKQEFMFPGSLPVGGQAGARLDEGAIARPRSEEPLVVLWDGQTRLGAGFWYHCEDEFSPVSVRRVGEGLEVRHTQPVVMRLKPREVVALGRQYVWLTRGGRDEALGGVRDVHGRIGLQAPTNGAPELRGSVVYCGHPGGVPERGFRGYGGFRALTEYVPTLRRMGVDLLWLLPIWEHGDGREWNLYAPFDPFQVSPLYGTAGELKELGRVAGARGIRLMFDLVPHGPPEFTPLAKAHPEWVALDPEGNPQRAWGQLAFDNAHPGWQELMRRAALWGAREFGAVGARVDCAAGGPLNWSRARGNRPSLSGLAGGLGMTRAIRAGYLEAGVAPVVLPEEYTGANVYYRVADLTYDAQFYFLQAELQERGATGVEWAAALQGFLHDQQQTLPRGALKLRWISNHDTVSWTFQKARPARVYGVERMRALLAVCAFVEGVPMLYQGDEDPRIWGGEGESNVEFLEKVYGLRRELRAVREGAADYASVRANGGVFACLRSAGDERVLVLISMNPGPVWADVRGAGLRGQWTDRMSGERLRLRSGARVWMGGQQVRVLVRGE